MYCAALHNTPFQVSCDTQNEVNGSASSINQGLFNGHSSQIAMGLVKDGAH